MVKNVLLDRSQDLFLHFVEALLSLSRCYLSTTAPINLALLAEWLGDTTSGKVSVRSRLDGCTKILRPSKVGFHQRGDRPEGGRANAGRFTDPIEFARDQ